MSGIFLNSNLISMLGGCYIEETKYMQNINNIL